MTSMPRARGHKAQRHRERREISARVVNDRCPYTLSLVPTSGRLPRGAAILTVADRAGVAVVMDAACAVQDLCMRQAAGQDLCLPLVHREIHGEDLLALSCALRCAVYDKQGQPRAPSLDDLLRKTFKRK